MCDPCAWKIFQELGIGAKCAPLFEFLLQNFDVAAQKVDEGCVNQLLLGRDGKEFVPDFISLPPERIIDDCTIECYFRFCNQFLEFLGVREESFNLE